MKINLFAINSVIFSGNYNYSDTVEIIEIFLLPFKAWNTRACMREKLN